jgi:L-ascorbate metabolism protein UlaG (beta-lactamase superfamily)
LTGTNYISVVTNAEVAAALNIPNVRTVATGDLIEEKGVALEVTGPDHAIIHRELPQTVNTGFVIDGSIWHPGDALDVAHQGVRVLLTPIGGPWMKASEAIDFVRAVKPAVVIPIHQSGLAKVHQDLHVGLLRNLAPTGTSVLILEEGLPTEISLGVDK